MIESKWIHRICVVASLCMVLIALLFLGGGGTLLQAAAKEMPYESSLFSQDMVHQVDIVVDEDDWQEMLDNAIAEEYISCNVVIDGDAVKNVGIRPKGNSSLTTVANSDSDRFSFKIEFDHYESNQTYQGLDKLCLNNMIQDTTYLKDYLCYTMMEQFQVDSPLCSFVWITVNGEDWGLYLAVEGVEESFAQRNYGNVYGNIYKPDSLSMGGGGPGAQMQQEADTQDAQEETAEERGRGGMSSSTDTLLQYSTDDPADYANIFDNSVFDHDDSDEAALIQALQLLSQGQVEDCLNIEEVLRYFVVHNYVLNGDSYTGSMVHNYYLREQDGLLSMIPWDYNLAFGGMSMGQSSDATSLANDPIDSPVSSGDIEDRPMVSWIFFQETYTQQYHALFAQWLEETFQSGWFETMFDNAVALISPYVEKDPTAFYTYEAFEEGVETLRAFCLLRAESIEGQLSGEIPSTAEGQSADSSSLIDASHLDLSLTGTNGSIGGFGGGMGQGNKGNPAMMQSFAAEDSQTEDETENTQGEEQVTENDTAQNTEEKGQSMFANMPEGAAGEMPGDMTGEMPQPPDGAAAPQGEMPQGQQPSTGEIPNAQADTLPAEEGETSSAASSENFGDTTPSITEGETSAEQEEGEDTSSLQSDTEGDTAIPQMPQQGENGEGFQPGQRPTGDFSQNGAAPAAAGTDSGYETWLLLAGSVLLLGAGLLFARFFR